MNFTLDIATAGIITIAIVNRIKAEVKIPSFYYTLIAIVLGAGLYLISVYAPDVVAGCLYAGLIGSGIYDIYKKQ